MHVETNISSGVDEVVCGCMLREIEVVVINYDYYIVVKYLYNIIRIPMYVERNRSSEIDEVTCMVRWEVCMHVEK